MSTTYQPLEKSHPPALSHRKMMLRSSVCDKDLAVLWQLYKILT